MEKDRYAAFAAKQDIDIYVNAAFAASRGERVNTSQALWLNLDYYHFHHKHTPGLKPNSMEKIGKLQLHFGGTRDPKKHNSGKKTKFMS
jgi:hypothetical protein